MRAIFAGRHQERLNADKSIAACIRSDQEKAAKLRLSRIHQGRTELIPVINPMLFGVLGAYWEDQSWQVLNNCAGGKE